MGLIKAVFDLLAFVLTWFLTWLFYPKAAAFLMKTPVYNFIYKWISITLSNSKAMSISFPEFFLNLPTFIKNSIATSSKQAYESLITSTSDALTVLTINVISFIALFIIIRLITITISKMGRKINKIFLIGPINSILGGGFGAVQGLLVVYLVVMLISYFPTTKVYNFVAKDIKTSYLAKSLFKDDVKVMGISLRYPKVKE